MGLRTDRLGDNPIGATSLCAPISTPSADRQHRTEPLPHYPTRTSIADALRAADAATAPSSTLDLTVAKALGNAPDAAQVSGRDPEGLGAEWETPGFEAGMVAARQAPDRDSRRAARARVWDSGEAQGIAEPVSFDKHYAAKLLPDYGTGADDWTITVTRFPPPTGWRVRAERPGASFEAESGPEDRDGALALLRVALAARLRADTTPTAEETGS